MNDRPSRVLVVDDHPAVQSGLAAALEGRPEFVAIGTAATEEELWAAYNRGRPDLVLLDYHLPGTDGFWLCRKLKALIPTPQVVIYSAFADSRLGVPAVLAEADGLVNKGLPAAELFAVLGRVVAGERMLPPLRSSEVQESLGRLDPQCAAVARQVLEGATLRDPESASLLLEALTALRIDVPSV